jgi:hypothetical protein
VISNEEWKDKTTEISWLKKLCFLQQNSQAPNQKKRLAMRICEGRMSDLTTNARSKY